MTPEPSSMAFDPRFCPPLNPPDAAAGCAEKIDHVVRQFTGHTGALPNFTPIIASTLELALTPKDAAYVVTAYRWGQRNAHSFVVGAFADFELAKRCADAYHDYRGGKYACEVTLASGWDEQSDSVAKQVYFIESSYYGMAHDSGHFHAADCSKRGRPSAKPFTVRELQNRVDELERELASKNAEIERLKLAKHLNHTASGPEFGPFFTEADHKGAEAIIAERDKWKSRHAETTRLLKEAVPCVRLLADQYRAKDDLELCAAIYAHLWPSTHRPEGIT